ncbi:mediator of RNA polymerase II transcription subunit 13 [Aspergillus brasiliensis]|uniref:Mediator of RNA polymerase II transcription subunit 13 n=1 Tax=Aspergillus brasiliensis TaxID=319629 RepID=A0A9W5YNR0_9EURO|nr:mediator of RNA polymerase II transcription subunit 13 [Aspergillus brasiliensis]GKZ47692.1 mediator of RNA polymerase II transcription subunit 13 [Aspergillus brasiliensis]
MDFPGGSITNIRVIDGFSHIYWRIYTDDPGESPTNGYAILKHLSRLKDLELQLRDRNCLVSSYPRRLCLWVFSATPGFESLSSLSPNDGRDDSGRLAIGSATLKVSSSGNVSSSELVKNLSTETQNAPGTAGSQRPNAMTPFATIYASFISAISGAVSLQLVRQRNAIPLGSRTLFTVVERDGCDNSHVSKNDLVLAPSLTTLQIQLTSAGKLTVALQTVSQAGLTRLLVPDDDPAGIHDTPPGTDLWLSPSGSIARLVAANPSRLNAASPYPSNVGGSGNEKSSPATRKQWKVNVLWWLSNFGLPVDGIDDEAWVEVEVWEPFYSRLAGEVWRPNDEGASMLPLKRILWPAIYCFRRTKSASSELYGEIEGVSSIAGDPLDFAEKWRVTEKLSFAEASPKPPSVHPEQPTRDQEASFPDLLNLPEGIESLSRASQYPDLQTASLVYPTPPDGATATGLNPTATSDTFADEIEQNSNFLQQASQNHHRQLSKEQVGTDVISFGPSAGLVVGSGLYDTNDDDDLFGDINEKDFGAKGITDADFSFFDDPDFDRGGVGEQADPAQALSGFMDTDEPEMQPTVDAQTSPEQTPALNIASAQPSPAVETANLQHETTPQEAKAPVFTPQEDKPRTISPPLSPVEVKKILFPESQPESLPPAKKGQGPGYYNAVAFKQNMSLWDQKYGADGKFGFGFRGMERNKGPDTATSDIPTVGLPRHSGKMKTGTSKDPDSYGSPYSDEMQESSSDSDMSSSASVDSDESASESGLSPATFSTRKRKRTRSNSGTSLALSQDKANVRADQETSAQRPEDSVFLGNFLSTFSDWSMAGYFSLAQNQVSPVLIRKDIQVQVAQLLVDQVTQSSLDHKIDGTLGLLDYADEVCSPESFQGDTAFVGGIERLDLNSLVSLQDSNAPSPSSSNGANPRQSSQRRETGKGTIAKIPPPHLRVRRGKDFLETLPPAISFWETFGLEPAHGQKDILAYCIHPHFAAGAADTFLERLGLVYAGCNLGEHCRGESSNVFDRGLGSWNISPSADSRYSEVIQSLKTICGVLGSAFLNTPPSKDSNIVVYIVNPFTHAAALVDICAAFWSLFQQYIADADKQQARQLNELVLQIIPMDFVTSAESLVVPPQAEYLNLALEVYSRCPPKSSQMGPVNCAPPVLLAEPIPKSIGFKLSSEGSSPLQEGKHLHVACSRSLDQRWLSVAWSDNFGGLQRNMSYCLRYRNSVTARPLPEVRGEIWKATRDIMDTIQARWRVIIVSTDPVDQEEVDTWSNFADQYGKARSTTLDLVILGANTPPDLHLEPPFLPIPLSMFNQQPSSTPVATPNLGGGVPSPDQFGNAPTPPGGWGAPANASTPTDALPEIESESLLTDIYDETWGVVLSHRLNSSLHQTEYRPALASGYLLRRKGSTDGDGLYTMSVNILFARRSPSSYDTLLREILGMYRDLATLARARGTRTVQQGTLPWHVATAIKAQTLLSYAL